MDQVYSSKVDAWLALILWTAVIACLAAFGAALYTGSMSSIVAALPTLLIGAGLPAWVLLGTRYILRNGTMIVKSGPFRWRIPLDQITGITPTTSRLSGPALSLDRLRIEYGRGRVLLISPEDKHRFIQDLDARRQAR